LPFPSSVSFLFLLSPGLSLRVIHSNAETCKEAVLGEGRESERGVRATTAALRNVIASEGLEGGKEEREFAAAESQVEEKQKKKTASCC